MSPLAMRYDPMKLQSAMNEVVELVGWYKDSQIALSCKTGEEENFQDAAHGEAVRPVRSMIRAPNRDMWYNQFIPGFDHTYFRTIWDDLKTEFSVVTRMRLMKLNPKNSYTFHEDFFMRLHIPIVTNPFAFLLVHETRKHVREYLIDNPLELPEMKTYHLPAIGVPYLMNTTYYHTAQNGGQTNRVHLVCSVSND